VNAQARDEDVGTISQHFSILGDLSVTVESEHRPITAGKQRAALVLLLLSPNRTVSTAALIDGIWGVDLPQHPDTALQIVISRLRGSLGPAAQCIVSSPSGYRIEVGDDEVDVALAQSAWAHGRQLLDDNDPNRAAEVLGHALTRWTSEPLADLAAFPFCHAARSRLRELRLSIYELRNDALLDAGRHIELLDTIDEWIAIEPWRERLRAQQVLALYRSGRQVDALRAYDAYRDRLVDELGVDPSRDLCELHRDVLSHAPLLASPGRKLESRIPLWTSLSLPFVGRTEEQERIFGRIHELFAGQRMVVLVEGEPGIGKTRLVLEVARRVQDDAIILSATANDSMTPAVVGLARAIVATIADLPDDELRRCLGPMAGDLASVAPVLRTRFPDLARECDDPDAGRGSRLVDAVTSCLTQLSRRAPIVLLLDDLQRSGASLLFVLGRLMASDEQPRILVLATARSAATNRSSNLADLAASLERRGRLERVHLDGLGVTSVERLLCRLGTREPTEEARLLHRMTNGHPFFLSEILHADDWQRALLDPPPSVREFVRRRVHGLGDASEGVLVDAAGLGIAFDVALLADIADVPRATTAALIDGAVTAGILRTVGKNTFTFEHELCRRALLDRLDADGRARLQHRIATVLERHGLPAAVLALHWRLVPCPEAEERARRYERMAGDALLDLVAAESTGELAAAGAGPRLSSPAPH
jgi:DNA-binding SARP family transcriptional activator